MFVEPKSTHLHVYTRVTIPRLGSVLLGTIMRDKGYDVRVYIEDIQDIDMREVLSADLVGISAITSTAPQAYRLADTVREAGGIAVLGGPTRAFFPRRVYSTGTSSFAGKGTSPSRSWSTPSRTGTGLENIQNLSYLVEWPGGQQSRAAEDPNLDVNPIPDYTLIEGWKPAG